MQQHNSLTALHSTDAGRHHRRSDKILLGNFIFVTPSSTLQLRRHYPHIESVVVVVSITAAISHGPHRRARTFLYWHPMLWKSDSARCIAIIAAALLRPTRRRASHNNVLLLYIFFVSNFIPDVVVAATVSLLTLSQIPVNNRLQIQPNTICVASPCVWTICGTHEYTRRPNGAIKISFYLS